MKALHVVLICLVIFVVFNYTAAASKPSIKQDDNPISNERAALHGLLKAHGPREKLDLPGLISLGDPIEDPKPHQH